MKKSLFALSLLLSLTASYAQPSKKKGSQPPSQSELNKMMEDAMNAEGMSESEKAEMKKAMSGIMPELSKAPGSPPVTPFTNNKKLVPVKDQARINRISKKPFTEADVMANVSQLYGKLMLKIPVAEKSIITKALSEVKGGGLLMAASITSLLQGHSQAAMGLALKSVEADPKNPIYQNNLAAILSQSGYPENAIPYLNKLSLQFPGNSTVLHNLGYAWLNLGEIDTASRYFGYAAIRNPGNPETKLCRGLIEEMRGDPQKAAENYVESFEELPNPFTETMAKNAHADDQLDKIDFNKLKSSVTIHEYFTKDWIKIPVLSDNVDHFAGDIGILNGYQKMFEELKGKMELMSDASMEEINALADKGEKEFIAKMANESAKGINMMSMPAVYVQKILMAYLHQWMEKYRNSYDSLMKVIDAKRKEITRSGENDKCPDFDRKNNEYMAYANPLIREFHIKKIEEFRTWLNTYCTWAWYITGNPKNVVLTQCITWTRALIDYYATAVNDLVAIRKSCVNQDGDGADNIKEPDIPNFTCPVIVRIPIGLDELWMGAEARNFDDNSWNIKQSEGAGMPNVTLSFGIGKSITEPGKNGNPYVKTGNGSVNASGFNSAQDELTPLPKILDELTPLPKLPKELEPLDPRLLSHKDKLTMKDAVQIQRAKLARKILNDLMTSKCPGELPVKNVRKKKFVVGLGTLEMEPAFPGLPGETWDEEIGAWVNEKGTARFENGFTVGFGELVLEPTFPGLPGETWNEEMEAWVDAKGHVRFQDGFGFGPIEFEDVEESGLQTVINNGMQMMERGKSFIKGLFE